MLLWADREPLERRWILLPTMVVGVMLFVAVVLSVLVGAIPLRSVLLNLMALPAMVTLWGFSYFNAGINAWKEAFYSKCSIKY